MGVTAPWGPILPSLRLIGGGREFASRIESAGEPLSGCNRHRGSSRNGIACTEWMTLACLPEVVTEDISTKIESNLT